MPALPSVTLCPAGTTATASARLRCHVLARELGRLGCSVRVGLDAGAALPDLLVVQKVSSPEIIDAARRVRESGGHVVFDIDDWGDAVPWVQQHPELLSGLLAHCSVVSVDTAVRAEVFAKDPAYAGLQIWVVPDPVDYVDDGLLAPPPRDLARPLSGCWFGNAPNVNPAVPYIQAALGSDRIARFDVITNAGFVPALQKAWPMLGIEAWALETFPQRLREHDFCLLIHDTNLEGVQKSNNKMLAALGQGVLPIVSNTPAYAETARALGLDELVIDSPADVAARLQPAVLQRLRERLASDEVRRAIEAWMPAAVARGFLDKVAALRAAPPAVAKPAEPAEPQAAPAAAMPGFQQFGAGNVVEFGENVQVTGYVNGDRNRIVIAGADSPTRLHIMVNGDGNRIVVDRNTELKGLLVCCGNHVRAHDTELHIGENTTVEAGGRFLLYNSGNVLRIGRNTMLSSGITIRCGESPHLLFERDSGDYLDRSKGVSIGDHVWIGENAYLTKSAGIADDCVVGACSVVTRRFERSHVAIAGNPARVVREGVQWIRNPGMLEPGSVYEASYRTHMAGFPRAPAPADAAPATGPTNREMATRFAANMRPAGQGPAIAAGAHEPGDAALTAQGSRAAGLRLPEGPVRLNLGCGDVPLPGYVNVDVAPARGGREPDVVCDIRDLSRFPDACADEVMAVHVIEHFYYWEVAALLKEWTRVLKPGGRLVLETPNLLTACEELLKNPELASRPDQAGQRTMWCLYGDPGWQDPLMCHRWLYTPQSLAQVMHEAGLRQLAQTPAQFKARHPRDMRVEGVKPA